MTVGHPRSAKKFAHVHRPRHCRGHLGHTGPVHVASEKPRVAAPPRTVGTACPGISANGIAEQWWDSLAGGGSAGHDDSEAVSRTRA
jgi:hypothetical protein